MVIGEPLELAASWRWPGNGATPGFLFNSSLDDEDGCFGPSRFDEPAVLSVFRPRDDYGVTNLSVFGVTLVVALQRLLMRSSG